MDANDPILLLVKEVGVLTGVISEQSTTLREIKTDMKEKISRPECENIVNEAIEHHRTNDHKPLSITPGISLKINGSMLKKAGLIIGGTALGGSGVWAVVKQILESLQ